MTKRRFPRPGQRILKSAVATGLCFLVYILRGRRGIPFYSAIAALQCLQPYREGIRKMAVQRSSGTLLGAAGAIVLVAVQLALAPPYPVYCVLVAFGVAALLYSSVLLSRKGIAYFSCVVFLSITMSHIGDENPYLFALNRVVDTLIGIGIAMGLEGVRLSWRRDRETLFVAALDDVLLPIGSRLSDFSRVELNRMLDDGLAFSLVTMRTAASFLEAMDGVRLRCPVILMDGAVLYDPVDNRFLSRRELSHEETLRLTGLLNGLGLSVFQNVILDDSVLIFHPELPDGPSRQLYEKLRRSPHRNYLRRPIPAYAGAVYLMAVDETESIEAARRALEAEGVTERYKVLCYPSDLCPGCSVLKLYRKDATKLGMLEELKTRTGFQRLRTFGNDPALYDQTVRLTTGDELARLLRREFEPPFWRRRTERENQLPFK